MSKISRKTPKWVPLIVILACLLAPVSMRAADPIKPIKPLVEPPDKGSPILPANVTHHLDWLTSFTINLNAVVAGMLAIGNVPDAFTKAKKAWNEMRQFSQHREAYFKALEQVEKIKNKQPKLLEELSVALERYDYRLVKLENVVKSFAKETGAGFDEMDKQLDGVLEKAKTLKQFVPKDQINELNEVRDRWLKMRDIEPLDAWVKVNLNRLKEPGAAKEWMEEYRNSRREWAAQTWLKRGSVKQLDKWANIEMTLKNKKNIPPEAAEWVSTYRNARDSETAAAKDFLTDFAIFVRSVNYEIEKGDKKFPILVKWTEREPGEFYVNSDNGLVPVLSKHLSKQFAEHQCQLLTEQMADKVKGHMEKGTYRYLPLQGLRVASPVLGVGVGGVTLYAGFQLIMRNMKGEITKPPAAPIATETPSKRVEP